MDSNTLLDLLASRTQDNMNAVESFKKLSDEQLNYKPDAKSWSILECIEHLNRYGNFYVPEIKSKIEGATYKNLGQFKSGLLGNYFAKMLLPKESMKKMKTFKSMDPQGSALDRIVLDQFLYQQNQILELLILSRKVDLTKIKTSISITKWIKLRLGDTLRVLVNHNLRHIVQANSILKK